MDPLPGAEATITDVVLEDDRDLVPDRRGRRAPSGQGFVFPQLARPPGPKGPFHAGPSLMIVVPTQEQVTLQFANGGVENLGWILTIAGLAGGRRRGGPLSDRRSAAIPARRRAA